MTATLSWKFVIDQSHQSRQTHQIHHSENCSYC